MAGPVTRRAAIAALLGLPACAVVAPFDEAELAAVRRGEATIVLLRFVATDQDGTNIPPFAHLVGDDDLGLARGDFDSAGVPTRRIAPARFPSTAARAEGALILLLSPGYHYLAIQGARRTDAFSYEARFRDLPRWRIEVPARTPFIHAGTFRLRVRGIRLLFGDVVIGAVEQDAIVVDEDGAWARGVAARDLPGLGRRCSGPRFDMRDRPGSARPAGRCRRAGPGTGTRRPACRPPARWSPSCGRAAAPRPRRMLPPLPQRAGNAVGRVEGPDGGGKGPCRRATTSRCDQRGNGAQGRNRTSDTAIFSRMLYQLSYLGPCAARRPPERGREIAEPARPVQPPQRPSSSSGVSGSSSVAGMA